jgi:IS30 family transposase
VLALTGGITPATRRRARLALGLEEREEISRGIAAGRSIRRIAARLGRAASTVGREVRRHGGRSAYRASEADSDAWDRGKEMADHKSVTVATNVRVYFCDPRSPWQRGSNENANGLLRQHFPRGTALSGYSQAHLDRIALRLNQRPRKTLGFETPADRLRAVLH